MEYNQHDHDESDEYDETPDRIRLLENSVSFEPASARLRLDMDGEGNADRANSNRNGADLPRRSSSGALHTILTVTSSTLARRCGQLYAASTTLGIFAVLVLLGVDAAKEYRTRPDFTAFYSAAGIVLCTVTLSTRQIYRQLTSWYMPDVQKYVVRILWMVPLYSIQSWCSLRFRSSRIYIDAVRDLYEAFVIQSFVYYLIELLGGEEELIAKLRRKDEHYGQHPGMSWFFRKPWSMGREFMLHCKYGVLQYVVAKTICTVTTVLLEEFDLYGEGTVDFTRGYVYISAVINLSQCWALYCLVKLFHATAEDLRHPKNWHPLGKFLCVKGVVFFTWWQSLGIGFLQSVGIIDNIGNWDADDVANGVQDYLICVEMLGFAVAHGRTFTEEEYLPDGHDATGETPAGRERRGRDGSTAEYHVFGNRIRYQRTASATRKHNRERNRYEGISSSDAVDEQYDRDGFDSGAGDYQPPTIRTLHAPMSVQDAFWSSTVPTEALEDIRRLRRGVSSEVGNASGDDLHGLIALAAMSHAEKI